MNSEDQITTICIRKARALAFSIVKTRIVQCEGDNLSRTGYPYRWISNQHKWRH